VALGLLREWSSSGHVFHDSRSRLSKGRSLVRVYLNRCLRGLDSLMDLNRLRHRRRELEGRGGSRSPLRVRPMEEVGSPLCRTVRRLFRSRLRRAVAHRLE
jgi:hypothetical protein